MDIKIIPHALSGSLDVIASKSLSHRYLIAAGLADGTSQVNNVLQANDIDATKTALQAFGVTFEDSLIHGGKRMITSNVVNVKESGSTLRFMIPIYLLDNHEITIHGEGRLPQRPLDAYETLFASKKIMFKHGDEQQLPLTLKGKIKGGYYPIPGDVSSQFISGLLFALPLRREDSVIELLTPLQSKGYVDLTIDVIKQFGIHILKVDHQYYIKGSQRYQPQHVDVEGDYSQAAFWIVAAIIGKKPMTLNRLFPQSLQGDKAIIDIAKQMGATLKAHEQGYTIYPSETKGIIIDLKDIPDLGPILMVLAARSEGTTIFENCERLRIKESDRLSAMVDILTQMGVNISVKANTVTIIGQSKFQGNLVLNSYHDHRIVMAIAIASILADGPITITDASAIEKSYPTFFNDFKKLGGEIHEIR